MKTHWLALIWSSVQLPFETRTWMTSSGNVQSTVTSRSPLWAVVNASKKQRKLTPRSVHDPVLMTFRVCAGSVVGGGGHPGPVGLVVQPLSLLPQAPSINPKASPAASTNVLRTAFIVLSSSAVEDRSSPAPLPLADGMPAVAATLTASAIAQHCDGFGDRWRREEVDAHAQRLRTNALRLSNQAWPPSPWATNRARFWRSTDGNCARAAASSLE